MSIFRKKEDSVKLPDLPSSKFSFPERVNLPPIEAEEENFDENDFKRKPLLEIDF